jgi:hypothetical protein
MRTTLQLDDDVLAAARVLARQKRTSLGAVISSLVRQALVAPVENASGTASSSDGDHRNGVPLLPWKADGAPVDLELVNRLRDELR